MRALTHVIMQALTHVTVQALTCLTCTTCIHQHFPVRHHCIDDNMECWISYVFHCHDGRDNDHMVYNEQPKQQMPRWS